MTDCKKCTELLTENTRLKTHLKEAQRLIDSLLVETQSEWPSLEEVCKLAKSVEIAAAAAATEAAMTLAKAEALSYREYVASGKGKDELLKKAYSILEPISSPSSPSPSSIRRL
jgi:hypothetical protein